MTVEKLSNSIYLGDRYCENVTIIDDKLIFQINLISRVKEGTDEWNYNNDQDLEKGCLVFDKVITYSINNGSTINDEIEIHFISVENEVYHFIVEGAEYSDSGSTYKWVKYDIKCRDFYLLCDNKIIKE